MRAAGLTVPLERKLLVYSCQATKMASGWSSMRKAFTHFAFSMAQVAPPDDDDDFVEESDNEIAPSGEPSDNTMLSEPDILAFFMNGDNQSGLKQIAKLLEGNHPDTDMAFHIEAAKLMNKVQWNLEARAKEHG